MCVAKLRSEVAVNFHDRLANEPIGAAHHIRGGKEPTLLGVVMLFVLDASCMPSRDNFDHLVFHFVEECKLPFASTTIGSWPDQQGIPFQPFLGGNLRKVAFSLL
jgi:hypothetical protein